MQLQCSYNAVTMQLHVVTRSYMHLHAVTRSYMQLRSPWPERRFGSSGPCGASSNCPNRTESSGWHVCKFDEVTRSYGASSRVESDSVCSSFVEAWLFFGLCFLAAVAFVVSWYAMTSIYLCIHLIPSPSVRLSVYLPTYLPTYLPIYLCMHALCIMHV